MKLVQFYRELFLEAVQEFEPVWKEEENILFGYRWHKNTYPLLEQFQIKEAEPDHPVLMYSLVLPESYLQTTIYEEVRQYSSPFDVSIMIMNRRLWLNAAIQTNKLQSSVMGFMNHARSELTNILECTIKFSIHGKFVMHKK
ncbi:hypothetical protein [Cohnella sp.]|uniref:hypothetical protein n=1 Tax=Cohnella sp. TaxID=1883426 RepID=UPI00356A8479